MKLLPIIVALICAAGSLALARPAAAAPPVFELPLTCSIPDRCFIEFYVDHAAGPALGDYRCGNRTYDTHRGTDFRVRSPEDFKAGIAVVAAADGKVLAVRDEMQDIDVNELGRDKVADHAAGNTVLLQHGEGWSTQYYHLRRGSVAVRVGDKVKKGDKLGVVGLSGDTSFPHLHLEVRDGAGAVVDPFNATRQSQPCQQAGQPVWSQAALATLSYSAIDATGGFTERLPNYAEAIYGRLAPPHAGGPLFFWFELFGVMASDVVSVQFVLPGEQPRKPQTLTVTDMARSFYKAAGLNREIEIKPGLYAVILALKRQDKTIFERRFDIDLK